MSQQKPIPIELQPVKEAVLRALAPIKPADSSTRAVKDFLFVAKRTIAGRRLPPYYLVYFLLVDLLGFKNLGRYEKVSWSVPIDYHGRAFLIEHRKLGIGIFVPEPEKDEETARQIVIRIQKAVKAAQPFYDWMADQAVTASRVNVVNNSSALFERFKYLLDSCRAKANEAEQRKSERVIKEDKTPGGDTWQLVSFPAYRLRTEASWLAMSAIEAFFSWTEHVLIHLAILSGRVITAVEVAGLAELDWSEKFKTALDLADPKLKRAFDKIVAIRRELRNYVVHGAFGKQGEAFTFHSGVGAVPVLLPHRTGSKKFTIGQRLVFDSKAALDVIEDFIALLWSDARAPAKVYIQESHLPVILTMAADGTYAQAMQSVEAMKEFVEYLTGRFDQAANMDWW